MLALQLSGRGHFLEFFFHKILIASFPMGNPLLKNVSGQKPREIAAQVLNQALGQILSPGRPGAARAKISASAKSDRSPFESGIGEARSGIFVEELLERALVSAQL